jgi:creatinine amidohydrolase
MNGRPYVLAETNWKSVKESNFQLALLPWGATEAHNYHLPYATDNFEAEHVAIESARKASEKEPRVIALPCVPFGVNTGQMDIKLCLNINPSTQYAILKDIVDVLLRHQIQKLVILNSHGGNNFKNMIREMSIDFPDMFLCSIDWWKIGDANQYFDQPGDHAGELETSVMMHLHPDLVLPLKEAGSGVEKKFRIKGLREGWVTSQRQWSKVTVDTGVGDPSKSSPEKGKAFLEMVTDEISRFLVELADTKMDDLYE